jgi:ABC-type bacteriocin/lantibiotic exporter with double-glycine peptidase domain
MKLVKQEDENGCAIACIAMVLGRSYQDVARDWTHKFKKDGVSLKKIMGYLAEHGCSIVHVEVAYFVDKDFARDILLKPFAPVHIVRTQPQFDSDAHVVVMAKDGQIFCPSGAEDAEDYQITDVLGIYR